MIIEGVEFSDSTTGEITHTDVVIVANEIMRRIGWPEHKKKSGLLTLIRIMLDPSLDYPFVGSATTTVKE